MTRKIILSRKGFDSANGGMPSPILPDGTLLSLPIPNENEKYSYDDLVYKDQTYTELIHQLKPSFSRSSCHLDPDLYPNILKTRDPKWQACFGQSHAALTHLEGNQIDKGDIFLFFGWFRKTELVNGVLRF